MKNFVPRGQALRDFMYESVTFKMTHFGFSCYAKTFYNMHASYEGQPIITYHERPKCVILNVTDSYVKNFNKLIKGTFINYIREGGLSGMTNSFTGDLRKGKMLFSNEG